MTIETTMMKDELDDAIGVVNKALGDTDLMFEALLPHHSTPNAGQIFSVFIADYWYFEVSFEEIRRNSGQGLVNLVKIRLENVLYRMVEQVRSLGTYCRIYRGTQPWVMVQGL